MKIKMFYGDLSPVSVAQKSTKELEDIREDICKKDTRLSYLAGLLVGLNGLDSIMDCLTKDYLSASISAGIAAGWSYELYKNHTISSPNDKGYLYLSGLYATRTVMFFNEAYNERKFIKYLNFGTSLFLTGLTLSLYFSRKRQNKLLKKIDTNIEKLKKLDEDEAKLFLNNLEELPINYTPD
ncbi:hypothetical protein ACFL1H_06170 [Nanoarchaeota archaeon]